MRICFVTHPSHANARNWISYFANELGHEVHVISVTKEPDPVPGTVAHDIFADFTRKWRYFTVIPRIPPLIREIAPDLVIAYRVQSYGFITAFANFHPLVLAAQDEHIVSPPHSRVRRWLCEFAVRRADWFNAWGPHMARSFRKLGAPDAAIATRPRGVRTNVFRPPQSRSARPTICTTRGLYALYRHDLLLEAMVSVVRQIPDVSLKIAGRGPLEDALRERIAALRLENNVELTGYLAPDAVADLLRESLVYVSTVATEGVSMSLHEAMACGTLPVVSDIEPNRLWVENGVSGLLATTAEEFASQIVRGLTDQGLRDRAAVRNIAFAREHLDWDQSMRRMEAEYVELVRRHAASAQSRS